MNEEIDALYHNHTWDITELPTNRKPIGCKWVYRIKDKQNVEVERYKTHLVGKGYCQKEGVSSADCYYSCSNFFVC